MIFAGLDGYKKGWVVVWLEGESRTVTFVDRAEEIFNRPIKRAAIDIPIGLPDVGNRACDICARSYLAPHYSRVFMGVRRSWLDCQSHSEAQTQLISNGEIKIDDLLDACACALAARDSSHRLPQHPPTDEFGLRMEINY